FDPVNELALAWVQVPALAAAGGTTVWAYYGNREVSGAEDAKGTYDADFAAVYHFSGEGAPRDATANANHAAQSSATRGEGLIGDGLAFDGEQVVRIAASTSLKLVAGSGFTFSAWVNAAEAQDGAVLLEQRDGGKAILVGLKPGGVYARVAAGGAPAETAPAA